MVNMDVEGARGMVMTLPIYDYWARTITGGNLFLYMSIRALTFWNFQHAVPIDRPMGRITSKKKGGPALYCFCCFWCRRRPYCT